MQDHTTAAPPLRGGDQEQQQSPAAESEPDPRFRERVTSEWVRSVGFDARCDSGTCRSRIQPGAVLWIERHQYLSPTEAARSYAVTLCEPCRMLQLATEWARACEVPEFRARGGTDRGLAGSAPLTRGQYDVARRRAEAMMGQMTEPARPASAEPAAATPTTVEVPPREALERRAERKAARGPGLEDRR